MSASIAIICGMRTEAALLPRGIEFVCTGGRANDALDEARRLLAGGAAGLLSFGIAGGLDPTLRTGALVIGTTVAVSEGKLAADAAWAARLAAALPEAKAGVIAGVAQPVAYPLEKAALFRNWQALVVDMESGAVARACAEAGKPFAVIRAVADPAARTIPRAALNGLTPSGRMNPVAAVRGVIERPSELPGLMKLAVQTRAALRTLADATRRLGPTLGFETLTTLVDE
ncbi:MAG TPA: nucleoside phosphorylase [Magnetospirillaceae bacterium]